MKTFGEMLSSLYVDLRLDSTNAETIARMKRYLNEGHQHLLNRPDLTKLRKVSLPLTSVANRAIYAFPSGFHRIERVYEPSSTRAPLVVMTQDHLRHADPSETALGNPSHYIDLGMQPVMQQPSSTGIWAVSTSGADTAVSVRLRGIRASGDRTTPDGATATLTGTTRVAIGSITDYRAILSLQVYDSAPAGDVSFYDASSAGNELARIPAGYQTVRYHGCRLWPTPASALTYTVDGQISEWTMTQGADFPMLPEGFDDVLEIYARRRHAKYVADPVRFEMETADWIEELKRLKLSLYEAGASPRVAGRADALRPSNLPSWFPNG